jgi:predicted phosphohydrolase
MSRESALDTLIRRPRPSAWEQFWSAPVVFIVQTLCSWRRIVPARPASPITVACISDTHNRIVDVPYSDILVHAGDLTQSGTREEVQKALDWISSQPHRHKIVVAGNHDLFLDTSSSNARHGNASKALDWKDIIYLENEAITISCQNGRKLRVFGSPYSPQHGNWAFQYPRSRDIWGGVIPPDTDILISHSPPAGHLDLGKFGCIHLRNALWCCRPLLHVFGHIHEGHGVEWVQYDSLQRASETAMEARGGLWNLITATACFLRAMVTPGKESQSLLVNASIVYGLRDDMTRQPIVVQI